MADKSIKVDVDKIKTLFKISKISMSSFSKMIGKDSNHLSARLHIGTLDEGTLDKICTMFDVKKVDLIVRQEEPKPEPKADPKTAPAINLTQIEEKLKDLYAAQFEIVQQLKLLNKEQPVNEAFRVDTLKVLNEILDTMKNMKVEMHSDQQKLYNHLKFNYPLQKAQ